MSDERENGEVRVERVQAEVDASVARARNLVARSRGLFGDPLGQGPNADATERLIETVAAFRSS